MREMFEQTVPEFLLGAKCYAEKEELGPAAMFSNLDISDPANGLDPLERRLYHTRVPQRKAAPSPAGSVSSAARRKPPAVPAPRDSSFVNPLPYAASEACSMASSWKQQFAADAPAGLLSRGLISNDVTRSNETNPGVCVLRQMKLPALKPSEETDIAMRINYVTKMLKTAENAEVRNQRAWRARNAAPSEVGSDRGSPGEVVPRQQRMTAGRPSLCRPLPDDVIKDPQRRRLKYSLNEDSSFASEHRVNYWWKGNPRWQKKTIKDHVRPYDNWTLFRDNAVQLKGCLRAPINTY